MDFKKLLSAPLHAGQAVVRDLMDNPDQSDAKAQVLKLLGDQAGAEVKKFTPEEPAKGFELPALDSSLSPEGQKRKAAAEATGQSFVPGEGDYTDSGPYGYLHKKSIHDALTEYEKEIEANRPHIDYEGIVKQRLADIAKAPEEHRTNPLYLFAMGMGNPEHAGELVKTHNQAEADANASQNKRWQELLDTKQQALESSIKQAMAAGDSRKVISGKWLETLAQIEQDRAKLSGQMQAIGERNAGSERRTELRGQWALEGIKARANAMLTAVGVKSGSAEYRNLMDNARSMLNMLVKKGETYEDAYDKVDGWMQDQIGKRPAAAPAVPAPGAPSGAAGGAAPMNEMEQDMLNARKKKVR
jgi:hypothetical protein